MKKTSEMVKLKDKTMYFPKVELTHDELYTLYVYGHAKPYVLRQIVVNIDMLENIIAKNSKNRPNKKDGYKYLLGKLQERQDGVMQDLIEFSQGNLDLIDLSVKYGFDYYDLKKAFDEVLDVDVNEYWKQHKKYVQKHTCLELYGVDSSAKVADVQAKQKATTKAKYGAENIMQTDAGKQALQKTMMERYGVPCNLMSRDGVYDFSKRCYYVLMSDSAWVRVLKKLASDKYDLNPEQFNKKTKYLLKQKLCGYDEKIYARKTLVYEAKRDIRTKCVAFLNEYHLQGSATATKYFAMEYCGELVGVASFKQHKGYVELKRLCFKHGVQVLGGLSKFIKAYFKSDVDCDIIKSFSDNNIGDGAGYARAGAELVGEIKTSLCFISPSNGFDMYSWQIATPWSAKSGVLSKYTSQLSTQNEIDEYIETKLPHRFDDGHGYDRVYRVGSKIWQFSRQK